MKCNITPRGEAGMLLDSNPLQNSPPLAAADQQQHKQQPQQLSPTAERWCIEPVHCLVPSAYSGNPNPLGAKFVADAQIVGLCIVDVCYRGVQSKDYDGGLYESDCWRESL
jgi:hypothetical protein